MRPDFRRPQKRKPPARGFVRCLWPGDGEVVRVHPVKVSTIRIRCAVTVAEMIWKKLVILVPVVRSGAEVLGSDECLSVVLLSFEVREGGVGVQ